MLHGGLSPVPRLSRRPLPPGVSPACNECQETGRVYGPWRRLAGMPLRQRVAPRGTALADATREGAERPSSMTRQRQERPGFLAPNQSAPRP
jgi:hypothetical protein